MTDYEKNLDSATFTLCVTANRYARGVESGNIESIKALKADLLSAARKFVAAENAPRPLEEFFDK